MAHLAHIFAATDASGTESQEQQREQQTTHLAPLGPTSNKFASKKINTTSIFMMTERDFCAESYFFS